jgi:GT2 family glycosyltransferase
MISENSPKVFVIVVTHKGKEWYDRCFLSLRESVLPVQTVVIDNASGDGSAGYIKENYPEIHIIESDKNLGFGAANNIGMRYAIDHGCDYCFLLNQDAWIESDTIAGLVNIAQANPEYGILSPVHLTKEKGNIEKLLLIRLDDFSVTNRAFFEDLYFERLKDVYWTKYVNAAAWFLPRKTIETIGGFDPIFYHYGEDDNYINRVLYHGLKIGICSKLRIVHDNDRPRPLYDSREHDVLMMIEYTDVNHHHDIKAEMRQHLFKAIKSFIKGRKKVSKQHYADYIWLKKHRKALVNSHLANRNKGMNWL